MGDVRRSCSEPEERSTWRRESSRAGWDEEKRRRSRIRRTRRRWRRGRGRLGALWPSRERRKKVKGIAGRTGRQAVDMEAYESIS